MAEEDEETQRLRDCLMAEAAGVGDSERAATLLLANLLGWYRREDKPKWWRFFDRVLSCDADDLYADAEAIAGLDYLGPGAQVARSVDHRYRFDPDQPHKLSTGQQVCDPLVERARLEGEPAPPGPGTLVFLDPVQGLLDLRRAKKSKAAHPHALIPSGPIPTSSQRQALRRLAVSVLDEGIDGRGPYRALRDLLLRRPPRRRGSGPLVPGSNDAAAAAVTVAADLDGGCLAIQGPPGSGKTTTAAEVVVNLVARGHSVGITANSHAVITNLLGATMRCAERRGTPVLASQKAEDGSALDHPDVTRRNSNADIATDLAQGTKLVAGTAWLFADQSLDRRLDYLVVDEAGQLSLANVCAVGTAAENLVLIGDPSQLSQPSEGVHPPGAAASGLAHLLHGASTIAPDAGIFLDRTHRLHPDICRFISEVVYDDRLEPTAGCERQRVGGEGTFSGSGLRWVPVGHSGNRVSSPEEANVVGHLVQTLLGLTWTDCHGEEAALRLRDVLVVAPYNAQVALIARDLPAGARVGTVDKFQGQEAPVVIVSLTTSSSDDMPRGMEFLYSRERLNVAVSRAQALAVMVGSPALLAAECRTVEQLALVSGLCRFVELAS